MRIGGVASTELFGGTAARPLAIVRVTLVGEGPGDTRQAPGAAPAPVAGRGEGPAVATPRPTVAREPGRGEQVEVEVGVEVAAPYTAGSPRQVTVIAESTGPADSTGLVGSTGPGPSRAAAFRAQRGAPVSHGEPRPAPTSGRDSPHSPARRWS